MIEALRSVRFAVANLAVAERNGQPVLLRQLAQVKFAAAAKRGDAGYNGKPAVVVSVQKQPQADSTRLTADIEAALASLSQRLPAGVQAPQVSFRQADFIQASVANVAEALRDDDDVMEELFCQNTELYGIALRAPTSDELVGNIDALNKRLVNEYAQKLWDEHPHIYRAAAFELKERIAA